MCRSSVIERVEPSQKLRVDVPHLAGMWEGWRDMRIIPSREFPLISFPAEASMTMTARSSSSLSHYWMTDCFVTSRFAALSASKPFYASRSSWRSRAAFGWLLRPLTFGWRSCAARIMPDVWNAPQILRFPARPKISAWAQITSDKSDSSLPSIALVDAVPQSRAAVSGLDLMDHETALQARIGPIGSRMVFFEPR